jgi:hypothetical protein
MHDKQTRYKLKKKKRGLILGKSKNILFIPVLKQWPMLKNNCSGQIGSQPALMADYLRDLSASCNGNSSAERFGM